LNIHSFGFILKAAAAGREISIFHGKKPRLLGKPRQAALKKMPLYEKFKKKK
jgi:hypothetical protein